MILWIGNGAVLKSSQWQLKEFWKLNNSVHELFIFKILLIAIDWNFKNCTIHKVIIIAIFYDGMNGIYLYFVNKHLYRWALLGL